MLHVSGWITDMRPRNGVEDNEHYLLAISSGYHQSGPLDNANYSINRPQGRLDYQIIYMQTGHGYFTIGDDSFEVNGGQVVIIPPHVPHSYTYFYSIEYAVYWVHCSGYALHTLLSPLEPDRPHSISVGQSKRLVELFHGMMVELQRKDPEFEGITAGMLYQLIYYILRKRITLVEAAHHLHDERIEKSMMLMHEQYAYPWTSEELAARVNLSPSRFIHLFSMIHHMPPLQFLNAIRINKAREFLGNSALSVREAGAMAGFENAQYFCRIFRKETGMTPSQYRKKMD